MSKIFNCSQLLRSYKSRKTAVHVPILCHGSYFPVVTLLQKKGDIQIHTYLAVCQ